MTVNRSICGTCVASVAALALMLSPPSLPRRWLQPEFFDSAPVLAPAAGSVIRVSTEPELQAAMTVIQSGGTILIAPGTYRLSKTMYLGGRQLKNVAIRGASDRREDVVVLGPGMTNSNFGGAPFGIWTGNGVEGVLIANLTIRDFYFHSIILNPGTASPHVYNVRLADAGEQLLKSNPDTDGAGVVNGIVEYSVFEYSSTSRDGYTNAIDVHGGANWIVRRNLFKNIRAPLGQFAGPAILMWRRSLATLVEGNTFVDCQREIAFGLEPIQRGDHQGGTIRNNMIVREPWVVRGDVAINVSDSPNTSVVHNTVLLAGTYPNAIEYRFPTTTGVRIVNNLTDAAIRSRDGAAATVLGNVTTVKPSLFVNPEASDLHLVPWATAAIDKGVPTPDVSVDWDGDARPSGSAPDVGADEFVPSRESR